MIIMGQIGWTGATTCVAGSTCSKINDYYSQASGFMPPPTRAQLTVPVIVHLNLPFRGWKKAREWKIAWIVSCIHK